MLHPGGTKTSARITVELIEADFEIGFSLVDLAQADSNAGDLSGARRVLRDAEDVFRDIEQRLLRLDAGQSQTFASLKSELRREIDEATARMHSLANPSS